MNAWQASEILAQLDAPTPDRRPVKAQISAEAPVGQLIAALQLAETALNCNILCDILGKRCEIAAVPVLIGFLQHPVSSVRSSAAEALGKIGDRRAGPALLERFAGVEESGGVRHMLAAGLGSVGHRPGIPYLILALKSPDDVLRQTTAWALGALGAQEADDPLRQALCGATSPSQAQVIVNAWAAVQLVTKALGAADRETAVFILGEALRDTPSCTAAAWALGRLGTRAAATTLRRALGRKKYSCFAVQRMREALAAIEAQNQTGA